MRLSIGPITMSGQLSKDFNMTMTMSDWKKTKNKNTEQTLSPDF